MNVDPHLGFLNSLPSQREQGNVWSNFYLFIFLTALYTFGEEIFNLTFEEDRTVLRISDEGVQEI